MADKPKNPAAVALGRLRMKGLKKSEIKALGEKGGKASRARVRELYSNEEISEMRRRAALARWHKEQG